MLNLLKQKLDELKGDNLTKINFLREYLQLFVLKVMDEKGYFNHLAFVGGTALRILYDLNRFSEDLDFCLIDNGSFSFDKMMQDIQISFQLFNLTVEIKTKTGKTVAAALIKFPELLHNLNLSSHKSQKLSIKIELDQNPPKGYHTKFMMINKEFLFSVKHYDLPSLFSGKLHALLCRKYTKGRDFYDLLWYLGKKIQPNYPLLEQSIFQTEEKKVSLNEKTLKELLIDQIKKTDFKQVLSDIEPFLADNKEKRYFTKEFFLQLFE